jgi:hypothetical protein
MSRMPEPTIEQCQEHARIEWEGRVFYACVYPQMGGYCAVALLEPLGGCFDVYVWHDGDFPFDDGDDEGRGPVTLHHCDAEQFIEFGKFAVARCECGGMAVGSRDHCL